MRNRFRSPPLVAMLLLCACSLFFVITQQQRVEATQTALKKTQAERQQLAEAEYQFKQFADYHEHWRQRGLFLPLPNTAFSEWLQAWAETANQLNPKATHRTFIKASMDIASPTSSLNQGMMTVEIESFFEPVSFAQLHSLLEQAPALLEISTCEWLKQEGTHQYNLKTRCRLHWQRFPFVESTADPLNEHSIYFPAPHHQKGLGQISSLLQRGKLLWTPSQRFSAPPSAISSPSSSGSTSPQRSYGWIKRSDGMELQWPKR